jgi:phosphate transport system substrate-binding protein
MIRTFALLTCLLSAAATQTSPLLVGHDAALNLVFNRLANETATAPTPLPADTVLHLNLGDRPAELPAANFFSIGLHLHPVCVAFHSLTGLAAQTTLTLTVDEVGALLLGTSAVYTTAQIVLPANGTGPGALAQSLTTQNVTGFANKTHLPAAVYSNTNVVWVDSDVEVGAAVAAGGNTLGLLGLVAAVGANVPCASVASHAVPSLYHAVVPLAAWENQLSVDRSGRHITASSAVYPLWTALTAHVNTNLPCNGDDTTRNFLLKLLVYDEMRALTGHWGFVPQTANAINDIFHDTLHAMCTARDYVHADGSSSADPLLLQWALDRLRVKAAPQPIDFIRYKGSGSGAAVAKAKLGVKLDFGVTGSFLSAAERVAYPALITVPAAVHALALVVHAPFMKGIVLPRCSIAGIFDGSVTHWDAPALQRANPLTILPHRPITVVVRSDRSGSTEILTKTLAALDAECTQGTHGFTASPMWDKTNVVLTAATTSKLFKTVERTEWSIGYSSMTELRKSTSTSVFHAVIADGVSGFLAEPTANSMRAALKLATVSPVTHELSFALSPSVYPFVGVSYYLYNHTQVGDCADHFRGVDFMRWSVKDVIAEATMSALDYVALPAAMRARTVALIEASICDGVVFQPVPVNSFTQDLTLALAIGIPLVIVAIVGIALLAARLTHSVRDVTFAPKDDAKPFALLFTDIQASTTLWARAPDDMGAAVDRHHAIIRECIATHKGYEVKTIGDCFMIATTTVDQAVLLARDIQLGLMTNDWGTAAFDDIYREMLEPEHKPRVA